MQQRVPWSMAMPGDPTTQQVHPRRPPAHLLVSLHRDSPSPASSDCSRKAQAAPDEETRRTSPVWKLSPIRRSSEQSNESAESNTAPTDRWFQRSNKNIGTIGPQFVDNDPPYFLQNQSSASVNHGPDADHLGPPASAFGHNASQSALDFLNTGTNGSSIDDFRSVIDDLTIENKRLKERLRRYERSYSTHLEKDRLFEVKIHGLSPRKKRELEETLHAFASSISRDESTNTISSSQHVHKTSLRHSSKKLSSSSTSNSRLVDSAYASASASGPISSSILNYVGAEKKSGPPMANAKMGKIQSSLDDIPPGLLPKHSTVMTEKGKKKLVVKRLEQLFTGKIKIAGGPRSHQLQQQEVSKSAARDDRRAIESRGKQVSAEGVREAHILPTEMELEEAKPPKLARVLSGDSCSASPAEGGSHLDAPGFPDQRPTRPLDLDPDRAQIPADNIEYIRHLGISTPVMRIEDPTDTAVDDGHGWVYLNLLISMAQLHIINVTPDFVRSAVSHLSTRFQLSSDGSKIRWLGGMEGTELSSDSGGDGAVQLSPNEISPNDSDSHEDSDKKRRKIDNRSSQIPPDEQTSKRGRTLVQGASNNHLNFMKYKPIFAHQLGTDDDEMSLDESISQISYVMADGSRTGPSSSGHRARGLRSQSDSASKRKRNEGAMVFYTGAPFCTDLSGDRDDISTPLHVTNVGKDGFSNHTDDALGCKLRQISRPPPFRTPSGSALASRPFKDYSVCARPLLQDETQRRTSENFQPAPTNDLTSSATWITSGRQQETALLSLDASGLGGTRPADHFAVTIKTRHAMLDSKAKAKFQRHHTHKPKLQRFLDNISKSSLDSFRSPDAFEVVRPVDLPLKTKIISYHYQELKPSDLPPPAIYHGAFSSSEEWSDDTSSDNDGEVMAGKRRRVRFLRHAFSPVSADYPEEIKEYGDGDSDGFSVDDSDNSSVNMLAHVRETDPDNNKGREQGFEYEGAVEPLDDGKQLSLAASAISVDDFKEDWGCESSS